MDKVSIWIYSFFNRQVNKVNEGRRSMTLILSVLDQSRISKGGTAEKAFQQTIELAPKSRKIRLLSILGIRTS